MTRCALTSVEPITAELRDYVGEMYERGRISITDLGVILDHMDRIDAEHERSLRDSVEVVRCRDCEHSFFADGLTICLMNGLPSIREDGYCSRGERREHDYED